MQHATQPKPSPTRKPPRLDARLIAVTLGLAALTAAHADSRVPMPREHLPAYAHECAACHMAYPPGRRTGASPPQDRITRSAWFERKHRKVDAAVWKLPSVRSAANCAACHTKAERGDFDDDRLRMPAGLDARLRRSWND